jgi:hypothetical protein
MSTLAVCVPMQARSLSLAASFAASSRTPWSPDLTVCAQKRRISDRDTSLSSEMNAILKTHTVCVL